MLIKDEFEQQPNGHKEIEDELNDDAVVLLLFDAEED